MKMSWLQKEVIPEVRVPRYSPLGGDRLCLDGLCSPLPTPPPSSPLSQTTKFYSCRNCYLGLQE